METLPRSVVNRKKDLAMARNRLLVLGTVLLLGGFHLATLRPGHEWGDDFSLYVAHSRNIAEGRPYTDTKYIYNPSNAIISPRSYPPIFPLLLAPVYRLLGMDLMAMKAFVVLFFTALLGVLFILFRKRLPLPHALGCLALFALNPYVWQHKDRLLSETPFMLFAYSALILAEKAQKEEGSRMQGLALGLLAGWAAYLAFGTRTVGAILIPAILGCELLRRQRLSAASLAIVGSFLAGVALQKSLLSLDGSYLDQLVSDPFRLARLTLFLIEGMGAFVENGYSGACRVALFGCLLALVGLACRARLRSGLTGYEMFAALNCLLLLGWPPTESAAQRFLLPILPLFFLYACEGLHWLRTTSLYATEKPAATMLSLALLFSYAGCYSRMELGPVRDGVSAPETVALFGWIKGRTDPGDVFLFQKPKALALFTGRPAVAHHRLPDEEHLWQLLRSTGVTHVVVCRSSSCVPFQSSRKMLEPFIELHGANFEKVYTTPAFRVYRFRGQTGSHLPVGTPAAMPASAPPAVADRDGSRWCRAGDNRPRIEPGCLPSRCGRASRIHIAPKLHPE
jgi:hypothetical protein